MKKSEVFFSQKTDYRAILKNFLGYRFLFIGTILLFLIIAIVNNRFSIPRYENSTSILIKRKDIYGFLKSKDMMSGLPAMYDKEKIQDELEIIGSFTLINLAVKKLNLEVGYFEKKPIFARIKEGNNLEVTNDLYTNVPIIVQVNKTRSQPYDISFQVTILNDSTFRIITEAENFYLYNYLNDESMGPAASVSLNKEFRFGELVEDEFYSFKVFLNPVYKGDYYNKDIYFGFNNTDYLTLTFQKSLKISKNIDNSSIYELEMKGENPQKITDFLNTLTDVYLERNLEGKNKILDNSILFIDNQVADISDSLSYTEDALQSYQTRNRITNLSFQGEKIFEKVKDLENDRSKLLVQQRYYDYIIDYFQNNEDVSDLVAPSSMNVDDKLLNQLIIDLIQLSIKRSYHMKSQSTKNLYLQDIETNISNLKNTILENIQYNKEQTVISLQEMDKRISRYYGDIASLPKTERGLLGIQRKFKLNDAIYTFLLQKRAEAQIAKASNTPDFEIIDPAKLIKVYMVYPKKRINLLIALMLGFLLPFSYIIIKDFLNNRVYGRLDIKRITNIPILGSIPRNSKKFTNVIANYPESEISEYFRSLRTSIHLQLKEKENPVLLVTSTSENEGKTFNAVNIASVLALEGKRTLLIDLDLRTSSIHKEFACNNKLGVSSYLTEGISFNDIVLQSSMRNLSLIPAGPLVKNPAEILGSEKTVQLIKEAKELYEFIVIDSTALDYVTDTYLLTRLSDLNLVIVRDHYTSKEILSSAIEKIQNFKIKNIGLIFNAENNERILKYIGFKPLGRNKGKRRGIYRYIPFFSTSIVLFATLIVLVYTGFLENPRQLFSKKANPIIDIEQADNIVTPTDSTVIQAPNISVSEKQIDKTSIQPEIENEETVQLDTSTNKSSDILAYNISDGTEWHYLVAGSYKDLPSAHKHLNELYKEGFNALVVSNQENVYRVCYGAFSSKEEAQKFKIDTLLSLNKKGWYFKSYDNITIPLKQYVEGETQSNDELVYLNP